MLYFFLYIHVDNFFKRNKPSALHKNVSYGTSEVWIKAVNPIAYICNQLKEADESSVEKVGVLEKLTMLSTE